MVTAKNPLDPPQTREELLAWRAYRDSGVEADPSMRSFVEGRRQGLRESKQVAARHSAFFRTHAFLQDQTVLLQARVLELEQEVQLKDAELKSLRHEVLARTRKGAKS